MTSPRVTRRQALKTTVSTLASLGALGGAQARAAQSGLPDLPQGTQRVCLSLRALEKQAARAVSARAFLPAQAESLSGIGYLEGFVVDNTGRGDLLLIGGRSESRPSLHLDDLIVNMRNVGSKAAYPYCSLDPMPQNIRALQALCAAPSTIRSPDDVPALVARLRSTMGPQQVVVGGVPRNSRHAHVLIDADYHMKKVSQGQVSLPNVTSYLDVALGRLKKSISSGGSAAAMGMARFWFHVGLNAPSYREDDGIVLLKSCPVVVLTEKQMANSSGELHDVQAGDPNGEGFAAQMSGEFANSARRVPVYAELENLFRLRALLLAMEFRGALQSGGMGFGTFSKGYAYRKETPMQASLPALANHRSWSVRTTGGTAFYCPIVCGGVGMDMTVRRTSFHAVKSAQLFALRRKVVLSRPSADTLAWVLPANV